MSYDNEGYYVLTPFDMKSSGATLPLRCENELTATFKLVNAQHLGGIGLTTGTGNGIIVTPTKGEPYCYINGNWQKSGTSKRPAAWNNELTVTTHWYTMTVIKNGLNLSITCKDEDTGIIYTGTTTISSEFENAEFCLSCSGLADTYFKEIKGL